MYIDMECKIILYNIALCMLALETNKLLYLLVTKEIRIHNINKRNIAINQKISCLYSSLIKLSVQ